MNCDLNDKFLSAYQDRELAGNSQYLVGEHVKSCQKCKEKLKLFQSVKELSGSLSETEAPYYLTSKTKNYIERHIPNENLFFWHKILQVNSYLRSSLVSFFIVFIISLSIISINSLNLTKKFESLVLSKQIEVIPSRDFSISSDAADDLEFIAFMTSLMDDQLFEGHAPLNDIAMLMDLGGVENRQIFDSITFFQDRLKQPIVESHFVW